MLAVLGHEGLMTVLIRSILLLGCLISLAAGAENIEYKIKAAYLYNFTKFISWPESNSASFNICIIGNDPFGDLLGALENKTALEKPINVVRYDNYKQIKDCQIAYLGKDDIRIDSPVQGTLIVGSLASLSNIHQQSFFTAQQGMIGFALEDEKIKLHINLKSLKQSGLGISAKLIEVATLIEGGGRE